MDRLQAAIAKARASRDAKRPAAPKPDLDLAPALLEEAPEMVQDTPPAPVAAPAPVKPIDVMWHALSRAEIDPRVLAKSRIVTREAGPKTAPFDVLRTRVTQLMDDNDWRRLCITSPGPECGKSTVTLNLAFSLARQPDLRIVVVDFDLRRPSLARMLGFGEDRQITRALEGRADLADQMVRVGENLAFATARHPAKNPSELLQGRRMRKLLDQIDADYNPDLVLFDLPPMMVSDDALGFLPMVDCALLIAAAEQSTIRQVDTCEQELAGRTNVLGVVLNKCEHPGEGYGYGYGYDYGAYAASA